MGQDVLRNHGVKEGKVKVGSRSQGKGERANFACKRETIWSNNSWGRKEKGTAQGYKNWGLRNKRENLVEKSEKWYFWRIWVWRKRRGRQPQQTTAADYPTRVHDVLVSSLLSGSYHSALSHSLISRIQDILSSSDTQVPAMATASHPHQTPQPKGKPGRAQGTSVKVCVWGWQNLIGSITYRKSSFQRETTEAKRRYNHAARAATHLPPTITASTAVCAVGALQKPEAEYV